MFADSLHDLGRPEQAPGRGSCALADDGVVLLVEHAGSDRLEENLNPVGQFFYACSALVCTPNALADRPERATAGLHAGARRSSREIAARRVRAGSAGDVDAPMNVLLELRR